jgi:GNAT superfamily N-acetyltransferase
MLLPPFEGATVRRVITAEDAATWEAGFVSAYARIFADEPYHEVFSPEEAAAVWRRWTAARGHITLLAVDDEGAVVGFGIAVPLVEAPDVARELNGLVPVKATSYLVELGVEAAWRRRGLARHLVRLRIALLDRVTTTHVVLRVAEGRSATFDMYRAMHFTDMGVSMSVRRLRTDGSVQTDVRHFMSRVLSQVQFDDDGAR